MGTRGRRVRRRRIVLAVAAGVLITWLIPQQLLLRDLRDLETHYIASREPTACATQNLLPLAFDPEADEEELNETLIQLIEEARDEAASVRRKFQREGGVLPFPPLRAAHDAVADAMAAQAELYDVMVDDPTNSDDELRTLGLRNTRAEREMATVRRFLLVDPAREWNRRFVCDEEPPHIPAP